jgi:hypothetical protein
MVMGPGVKAPNKIVIVEKHRDQVSLHDWIFPDVAKTGDCVENAVAMVRFYIPV